VETPTVRKQKSGDQLAPGDWLAPDQLTDGAAEVLHVLAYRPGLGASFRENEKHVHLLVRQQGKVTPYADTVAGHTLFDLASDEELAGYREATERAGKIADIRAYADWLESNPDVPIGYGFGAQVDLHSADGIAQVKAFAAKLGGRYRDDLDDRTQTYVVVGSIEHRIIAWHPDGRPAEPKPLVDPDASMEAHYDAEADSPAPHPSWPTEAELKPWESLAPAADRLAESIGDSTGLGYSRADEGETTQAVGRVPMHTGAMVQGDELVTDEGAPSRPGWHAKGCDGAFGVPCTCLMPSEASS